MHFYNSFNTTNPLKSFLKGSTIATTVALLASCGGGGGDSADPALGAALASIQGEWASECFEVSPSLSGINQLTITDSDYDQNTLFFVGNATCSGQLILLVDSQATYTLGAGTTITPQGIASHIDINFGEITATSTNALDAQLALANTSFAEFLATEFNVADVDNISAEDLGLPPTLFSLTLIDGDTLINGDLESNQGSSDETRLTELSTGTRETFTRQ